jgi:hypothetical protein
VSQGTSVLRRRRWFILKKNQFLNLSHDFYSTALQYLNAWGVHFDDIHHAECMLLKTVPQREKIEETVHFFSVKADVIAIDEDSLFDEISSSKTFVTKEKIKEWDMNNANTCARWSEVFLHFSEKMVPYLQLQRLFEISLCLPGSNASVESYLCNEHDMDFTAMVVSTNS